MIELRLDLNNVEWKALAFAILLYFVITGETWERLKKNTSNSPSLSTSGIINDREARVQRRFEGTLGDFGNQLYDNNREAKADYERWATAPRTFSRQAR